MLRRILIILLAYIPAGFVIASLALVTVLKWAPVACTPLMLKRNIHNIGVNAAPNKHQWVPLDEISDNMIKAVVAAEDNKFFLHKGFDFEELKRMKQEHLSDGSPMRGCSTISQQTAKNCFTFCGRNWIRKIFEVYYTVLIEKIWGKRRILEVYLNVAEMGPGLYGVEATANSYFHIHASDLAMADASSLACCLPSPLHRDPSWVCKHMHNRRAAIAANAQSIICPITQPH